MKVHARFADLLAIYRAELLERVVPFWMEHSIDRRNGGFLSCVSDAGEVLSEDKYMWSQLRAIYTFSKLYNRIERRQEWLDVAWNTYVFVKRCGRDEQGRWVYAVDKDGRVLQGATSIYADGFAIYGLTELARATGDREVLDLALETYRGAQRQLAQPGSYGTAPYTLPQGIKAHGVSMIFSSVFGELGELTGDPEIVAASLHHAREVMDVYRRPERRLLFEFASLDGQLVDSPQGRSIVPGHAIESMWFMMHVFRRLGDQARIRQAAETIRWHLERGWDREHGGILLGLDAEGGEPWWQFADTKLWWPHTEALYALLLAYEQTREDWCLEWYEQVHDYAFTHFPVPTHGEWTQKLDRYGKPLTQTVALPVKDPFHLPRALIHCIDVLERLA
ncbi:MAG: AGE family epimerase/isomerase [Chloroflexi bacterium]|nr:AGE family epimerase/isomerase [Chloroflexota bacterium]